jgi:hypothetical protein
MSTLLLTQSQQLAIDSFKKFLDGPEQVFMLNGAAGTGKTTLLKEFLEILKVKKRFSVLMAPTGRAAFIISQKTNYHAATIHRIIYQLAKLKSTSQNKEDEDDGGLNAKFVLSSNSDPLLTIYIVDEASLISDVYSENEAFNFGSGYLLQDLFQYVRGRKIIFIGDYAQLPPIGMNFSPALDSDYVSKKYNCEVAQFELREVVRQCEQSGILRNVTKIRNSIDAKTFLEFKIDEADDCHCENIDLLRPYFKLFADKPSVKSAIVAFSNKQVLQYNQYIRCHYFGEDANRLLPGELLMIARNTYSFGVELFNGNIVLVTACQDDSEVERRIVKVKLGKNRIESVELRFRKVTIKFNSGSKIEELSVPILDNFLDEPNPSVGGLLARALLVDFNNRLPKDIKEQLPNIKRIIRSKESLSTTQQEIYNSYINLLIHDPYYNAVICKYGYAVTCHKAQGGEWENVFVDMCRFGGTANEDYFRWAYTAMTRAGKQLWLYHSPEFSYISDIVVEKIQKSPKIMVTTFVADNEDFCDARLCRIKELAMLNGISVTEDKTRAYQQWIIFTAGNDKATFILWLKATGYNGRIDCHNSTSDDFKSLCVDILEKSYIPKNIPFVAQNRPFAQKLHDYILSLLEELDIQLLNISQEQYHDTYHLKTDGLAKVEMWYNDKGFYTYMKPISSLGVDDEKLEALRQKFI